MKYILPFILLALSGCLILSLSSCQEDRFSTNPEITLDFSVDTLRFDTVFTELGSATRILKAYNTSRSPVEISRVYLENGSSSKYRFNVDGYTVDANGNIFGTNEPLPPIPVAGKDSIYIFIEVTIDPDEPLSESPFVHYENIRFETNGNDQHVVLEAFGQNANYIPSRFSAGTASRLTCDMMTETWDDPKPYVIYGVLFVDSCELIIPAGTDIYIHGGLVNAGGGVFYNDGIWFFEENSTLTMQGTLEEPITVQGDRLEAPFAEVSGQWGGIRLGTGPNTHTIEHTIIKNSIVGLRVDSAATLEIRNSEIRNTSNAGLLGIHSNIYAENCLIVDNGANSAQLEYGGSYEFNYCTITNYGSESSAIRLSNAICQDFGCVDCVENEMNASFTNCIIMGSRNDEISFSDGCSDLPLNVSFENCIVKVNELLENYPDFFTNNCINSSCFNYDNSEPLFEDQFEGDYHLDSLSFAEEKAIPLAGIPMDLDGDTRDGLMPDIGCYESDY